MEKEERKILVEVSQEEYEKIKAGALNADIPTYESIKQDVLEKISADDVKVILSNHKSLILDSLDDMDLIIQIRNRSQSRTSIETGRDTISQRDYMRMSGTLQITKRDYSQVLEPTYLSQDTFYWRLEGYPDDGIDRRGH